MADVQRPSYVVLREVGDGLWQLVGEVPRRPGLPSRAARAHAIQDAAGGEAEGHGHYKAVLRSEWRIASE